MPVPSTSCLYDIFPINMFSITETVSLVSNPVLQFSVLAGRPSSCGSVGRRHFITSMWTCNNNNKADVHFVKNLSSFTQFSYVLCVATLPKLKQKAHTKYLWLFPVVYWALSRQEEIVINPYCMAQKTFYCVSLAIRIELRTYPVHTWRVFHLSIASSSSNHSLAMSVLQIKGKSRRYYASKGTYKFELFVLNTVVVTPPILALLAFV